MILVLAVLILTHIPRRIEDTIHVSTTSGETVEMKINVSYYANWILPSYVKGSVAIDGTQYTDQYTFLKALPGKSDNKLFPENWWKDKSTLPNNMTFYKSDYSDVTSATANSVHILNIEWNKNKISAIYCAVFSDTQTENAVGYFGPADTAEDANLIADHFGLKG